MEKLNYKSILRNTVLIFLIVLVLGYNLYYFLIAPMREQQAKIDYVINEYDEESVFLNEFSEYVVVSNENMIIFLDQSAKPIKMFDFASAPANILDNAEVSYGLFEDELIFIYKNEHEEVWIDAKSSELILRQEWN
jgi:hypothetical protein